MVEAIQNALGDERFRSRKFIFAAFTLGFATIVVIAIVAAYVALFIAGSGAALPELMPVLWWWAAVASGVMSLYGTTEALNTVARREK